MRPPRLPSEDPGVNDSRDRELGMDRNITRRDFLNGVALTAGAFALAPYLQGFEGVEFDP